MALLAFAIIVMAVSVFVSMSRGGITGLAAGLGLMGLIASLRWSRDRRAFFAASAVVLFIVAGVTWAGWNMVFDRLGTLARIAQDPLADGRAIVTMDTLELAAAFPVFGCGFGVFRHVYPMFMDSSLPEGRFLHAHNDWAQMLAEGGIVGFALALAITGCLCFCAVRAIRNTGRRGKLFALGTLVSVFSVVLHGFVDYGLHKPTNPLLLAFSLGLIFAGFNISEKKRHVHGKEGKSGESGPGDPSLTKRREAVVKRLVALFLFVPTLWLIRLEFAHLRGALARVRLEYDDSIIENMTDADGRHAVVLDGIREAEIMTGCRGACSDGLRSTAIMHFRWSFDTDLPPELRLGLAERAEKYAGLAVVEAPTDYLNWLWLARSSALLGKWDRAGFFLKKSRELAAEGRQVELFPE